MRVCEFCKNEVDENHANCQSELEMRLITFHGISENVLQKAGNLKSIYKRGNSQATEAAIEELLNAIDPMQLATGSHLATLLVKQIRSAHQVAEVMADDRRHAEASGAISQFREQLTKQGMDAIGYVLRGRKEPGRA
jgi:hypothetical protein